MDKFLKYQDKFVAGEDVSGYKFSNEVTQMPKQFNERVQANEKRIKSAKSLPYFLRDNLSKLNKGIYTLSEKASIEKALKNERKRLLRQRSEVMTIIGKNGQILTSVEGTFGNVYFNDEIAKKIKDNIIILFFTIHNAFINLALGSDEWLSTKLQVCIVVQLI